MPECHRCEYAGRIKPGTPWEKTPCAKCKLSENQKNKGLSRIDIDRIPEYEEGCYISPPQHDDGRKTEDMENFFELSRLLLRMDPETMRIVVHKLVRWGEPVSGLAKELGLTEGQVHRRLKKALDDYPVLKSAIRIRRYRKQGDKTSRKQDQARREQFAAWLQHEWQPVTAE